MTGPVWWYPDVTGPAERIPDFMLARRTASTAAPAPAPRRAFLVPPSRPGRGKRHLRRTKRWIALYRKVTDFRDRLSSGCRPYFAEDDPGDDTLCWLCPCGEWIEDGRHCPDCLRQPPWGCPCMACEGENDGDTDEEDADVDFIDYGYGFSSFESDLDPFDPVATKGAKEDA